MSNQVCYTYCSSFMIIGMTILRSIETVGAVPLLLSCPSGFEL